ncbi:unnamed protein product [Blepharisma stoltei]|uniref:Uncharacterized protein n=1 Tax=Blepharisma stoltei TaxID=1481888 RepID=A0AAU9K4T1_9CILI|nr:unnamed protein product [Blepharisma stoltei]
MESLDHFNLSSIDGYSKRKEKRSQTHIENERDRYLHLRQKYDELLEYCTHSKLYYEEEIRRLKLEVNELKGSKKYNKSNEKDTEILKELHEIKSKISGLQKRN